MGGVPNFAIWCILFLYAYCLCGHKVTVLLVPLLVPKGGILFEQVAGDA